MDERSFNPGPYSGSLIPVTRVKFTPLLNGEFDVIFDASAPMLGYTPVTLITTAAGTLSDVLSRVECTAAGNIDFSGAKTSATFFAQVSSASSRVKIRGVHKRVQGLILLLCMATGPIYINLLSEREEIIGDWSAVDGS